jgi:hypothetical protein
MGYIQDAPVVQETNFLELQFVKEEFICVFKFHLRAHGLETLVSIGSEGRVTILVNPEN